MQCISHSQEKSCRWNNKEGENKCIPVFLKRKTWSCPLWREQQQKTGGPLKQQQTGVHFVIPHRESKLSNQLTKGKVLYEKKRRGRKDSEEEQQAHRLQKWNNEKSSWLKVSNIEKKSHHIPSTTKQNFTLSPAYKEKKKTHTCKKQQMTFSILRKMSACQFALWSDSLACL